MLYGKEYRVAVPARLPPAGCSLDGGLCLVWAAPVTAGGEASSADLVIQSSSPCCLHSVATLRFLVEFQFSVSDGLVVSFWWGLDVSSKVSNSEQVRKLYKKKQEEGSKEEEHDNEQRSFELLLI
ncbi:unnamed protein product [Thlaspi arvense]|uniref:Uncharacterized protein n=1 Tax=Thlaspi arvense TaxID=13288 RepID=A0AAU9SVZ7_THLAR|nr:unnamed protein product [Thlaspi arvense]